MDDARKAFMATIGDAWKQQKRLQRSDDILNWIAEHWRLFCSKKSDMNAAISQLGKTVPYNVDSLCDLLGIPTYVYFKRSPVTDIGGTLLSFGKSKLLELFKKCREVQKNHEACLFVIAGQKSICITNMQTAFENCDCDFWYKDDQDEIHVFKATEAGNRLPNLFTPEENYG